MIVSTLPGRRRLTLYRGERPEKLDELRRVGVVPKDRLMPGTPDWPSLGRLQIQSLPPALVVAMHPGRLQRHVTAPATPSAMTSFTASRDVAVRFALHGGRRDEGLLIATTIVVETEQSWQGFPRWGSGGIVDSLGRRWIRVETCEFANTDGIVKPRLVEHFHQNGRRDDEYVLLDELPPGQFTVYRVSLRPRRRAPRRRLRRSGGAAWWIAGALILGAGLAAASHRPKRSHRRYRSR